MAAGAAVDGKKLGILLDKLVEKKLSVKRESIKILLLNLANSKLCWNLIDLGYRTIRNVDEAEDVVKGMRRSTESKYRRRNPKSVTWEWAAVSTKEGQFDCIVNGGGVKPDEFDLFEEMLKEGGFLLYCIEEDDIRTLRIVLQQFEFGYGTRIDQVKDMLVVILEKHGSTNKKFSFPIDFNTLKANVSKESELMFLLNEENESRLECYADGSIIVSPEALEVGVKGFLKVMRYEKMKFTFKTENNFYSISVLDRDTSSLNSESKLCWVFLLHQDLGYTFAANLLDNPHQLFNRANANTGRLVVVWQNNPTIFVADIKRVKADLGVLCNELSSSCRNLKVQCKWLNQKQLDVQPMRTYEEEASAKAFEPKQSRNIGFFSSSHELSPTRPAAPQLPRAVDESSSTTSNFTSKWLNFKPLDNQARACDKEASFKAFESSQPKSIESSNYAEVSPTQAAVSELFQKLVEKSSTASTSTTDAIFTQAIIPTEETTPTEPRMKFKSQHPHSEEECTTYRVWNESQVIHPQDYFVLEHPNMENLCISRENICKKKFIKEISYEETLTSWLKNNLERWSDVHETWNTVESRKRNKMDGVFGWNSSRPTDFCRSVIQGIVKSVINHHESGRYLGHGNLNSTDNYILSFRRESHYGIGIWDVDVQLVHRVVDRPDRPVDFQTDMSDLLDVLLKILQVDHTKHLPRIWQDLFHKISSLCDDAFVLKLKKDPSHKRRFFAVIKDHPSLWGWRMRVAYYESIWRTLKEEQHKAGVIDSCVLYSALQAALRSLDPISINWRRKIPVDTPYANAIPQYISNKSSEELLRYIRALHLHIFENDHEKHCLQYFCSGPTAYHDLLTTENDDAVYNEIVTCELFHPFLTSLHMNLIEETWSKMLF